MIYPGTFYCWVIYQTPEVNPQRECSIYPQIVISPSISHLNPQYNNKGQITTLGTSCPTLYDKRVGSFMYPAKHNIEDVGDGAYGFIVFTREDLNIYM